MISQQLIDRLKKVKLLIFDVDGILTDARTFLDSSGNWCRLFNVRDGWAMVRLIEQGYKLGIITGAKAKDIQERVKYLKIHYLFEGQKEKTQAFEEMLKMANLTAEEVSYMGDDIPDLPLVKRAGFGATVPDALKEVKAEAHWVSECAGGHGAVRELCDLVYEFGAYAKGKQL